MVNSATTGPQFASYYNDTYLFSPSVPTLTIVGTNLDQVTKGFSLVNSMSAMGSTALTVTSQMSSQVTLALPTSMASGTYYVVYDENGADEFVLGYLNTTLFGGGTGGGGMLPASVHTAAASTQPSLTTSSGTGGIQTMSLNSSSSTALFSYSRPAGGTYVGGRYGVGGLQYEVQQSEILGAWSSIEVQEVSSVTLENGWERVTVRVPVSGDRAFLRVKVSD